MFVRGNAARLVAVSCLLFACSSDDDATAADAGAGGNGTGGTAPQGGTTGGAGTGGTLEGGSGGAGGLGQGGTLEGGAGGSGGTTGGALAGGQGGSGGAGGSGGGLVPECPVCARLAYCATSDTPDDAADLCSGLNEGQEQAIYDQCLPNCDLLSAVATADAPCADLVAGVAAQNPVLAAACPDDGAGGAGGGGGEGGAGGSGGLAPYTQEEVQGIINASCSCHVQGMSGGMSLAGDFTVNTVGVSANGAPVNRIEPGDRTQSYLFHKIAGTAADVGGGGGRMPLGGQPLSDEQIERIGLWIDSL